MIKYPERNATSKKGVNYVRNIIESANSIFNEVQQQNDIGIDAFIEIIKDEKPINKFFAAQIKSGESYYDNVTRECRIPVDNHYEYE